MFSAAHVRVMFGCSSSCSYEMYASFHCARFGENGKWLLFFVGECNMKVWFRIKQIQNAWKSILRIVVLVIQPHVFPCRFHSHDYYYDVVTKQLFQEQHERQRRRCGDDDEEDISFIFLFIDFFLLLLLNGCVRVRAKRKRRKIEDKTECPWKSIT